MAVQYATRVQLEALANALAKSNWDIQKLSQGTFNGPTINPAQRTRIDAELAALKAAVDAVVAAAA
jgi:hypothetical protein